MGNPKLVYSPIQFCMANQYRIFPIIRLKNIEVDLAGVKTVADFEVKKIMDENDPYPTLLGIDWAFDNSAFLNLKKETKGANSKWLEGTMVPGWCNHWIHTKGRYIQSLQRILLKNHAG